jgi:plasmid stabilization system protein ParE
MAARYRIQLSKCVAADLEAIFDHIAKDSPANAGKMVARILTAIERLKILPHRNVVEGQSARLKHPVRSVPVQSYIVYFRVIDEHHVVRILQVRHGARKRPKRFD